MSQAGREGVLNRFREGKLLVLVATDVAARGLDIANVDLVVHYELPRDQDSFLHRCVPAAGWWHRLGSGCMALQLAIASDPHHVGESICCPAGSSSIDELAAHGI